MRVIATAGHVDHGKSTLLTALTGRDPDRLAEEKRRGLTIDLGFVSMRLPDGEDLAFVDVPGHRRYFANTLAGIATAPAVLFVVAADEGWQPQSQEHLAAVDAFGIRRMVVAVTKSDLADPAPVITSTLERLARGGRTDVPAVGVSARSGAGVDRLRELLSDVTTASTEPSDVVRLWIDRVFTMAGSGTVVTGTLGAGTLRTGSQLELSGETVSVRGLHCLGVAVDQVEAPARVAVNLRRIDAREIRRGQALVTPNRWWRTDRIDVRIPTDATPPTEVLVHCGTAAVVARVRPLGDETARLSLSSPLELHNGDRLLLRDTGRGRLLPAVVLDVVAAPFHRRGDAALHAASLTDDRYQPLRSLRIVRHRDLVAMGESPSEDDRHGDWVIDPDHRRTLTDRLAELVDRHGRDHPLDPGMPVSRARQLLRLPDVDLVAAVAGTLHIQRGRLYPADRVGRIPEAVAAAASTFGDAVRARPFHSPTWPRLRELGLSPDLLSRTVSAGLVLRVGDVHLLPDAPQSAVTVLRGLPQPFTVAQAREALDTTRRVVIPLLEYLDDRGLTRLLPDHRRVVVDSDA
ncbi:selenocysteine-specific elongation factor [Stackebrandtia endophytica]|uniref:Selenocysteine-specific elongation factor n=1 Tax=Stackebrandtia endophytica TaxID=1496996 RepID=A0A543B0W3_9ACTN|nr:selenocysteine-specific translation elongation factor [Stackebrandtia endophytica]TQL78477.1 selenocysteine-specific elongation factor [Stackebrandtia endophytica]